MLFHDEPAGIGEKPRTQTTLGSASAERMVVTNDDALIAPKSSRKPLILTAFGVAVAAAVVGVSTTMRPSPNPTNRSLAAITPEMGTPPAHPPKPQVVPTIPEPPKPLIAATTPPKPRPAIEPKPQAATKPKPKPASSPIKVKVKVVIASEPPGADVCFAKDHRLLGKTNFEWSADRSSQSTKLLVRKRGYRGQEIAVDTDHDTQRQITLHKLGRDDLDDTDNCER